MAEPESGAGRGATAARPDVSRSVRRRTATRRGATLLSRSGASPQPTPGTGAAPVSAADPSASARLIRRWRRVVAALCVLLAAALVGAGLIGRDLRDKRQVETAHQQALATARQAAVDFMSISAATVDNDIERIAGSATGDFREEFTRGAAQVRTAVVENKVAAQGTVLRTGLVSGDTRSAVILVAVDATVKNKGAPNGRLSHYRIRVGLARDQDSDRWLVSQLQFVG